MAAAAADDAAWAAFQKGAAWWLGEHANAAMGEYAGQAASNPSPLAEDTDGMSAAQMIALQAGA